MALGYASKGLAGTALGFGIGGTALGLANSGGLLSGLFGGSRQSGICCGERAVSKSELDTMMCYQNELAKRDSELAEARASVEMHKANEVVNQKISDTYVSLINTIREQDEKIQAQVRANELRINQIDVNMQRVSDGIERVFDTLNQKIDCCCDKLGMAINQEAERRACADNTIVTYVNSTFQPNIIARPTITGGTVGAATGSEATYNPLKCGCNCNTSPIMTPEATPTENG